MSMRLFAGFSSHFSFSCLLILLMLNNTINAQYPTKNEGRYYTGNDHIPPMNYFNTLQSTMKNGTLIQMNRYSRIDSNMTLVGQWRFGECNTVELSGTIAFMGIGFYLFAIDISDPGSPVVLSQTYTPGIIEDIKIDSIYAYIADGQGGLRIFNIFNLENPVEIGYIQYSPGTSNFYGVVIRDDIAYTADGFAGLRVINVSDPTDPQEINLFDTGGSSRKLAIKDSIIFIVNIENGLKIADISDPTNIFEIGNYELSGYIYDIVIDDNTAFIAHGFNGLSIIDVSNPSNPSLIGSWQNYGSAHSVTISENYAFIADASDGLRIIDISDQSNPIQIGSYDTDGYAYDVAITDTENRAVVADFNSFITIDVANPDNPLEIKRIVTNNKPDEIIVIGTIAYILDPFLGCLVTYDVSDISHPNEIGSYFPIESADDFCVINNTAYIANRYNGLSIIDVSDPGNMTELSSFITTGDNLESVTCDGNLVYAGYGYSVAGGVEGIRIIDVSDPTNPQEIGFYDTGLSVNDMVIKDSLLYILESANGLSIVDVTDATNPQEIGSFTGVSGKISLYGNSAYIINYNEGLWIIDISDPANPFQLSYFNFPGIMYGFNNIAVDNNFLYVAAQQNGLICLDITDPTNPNIIDSYNTNGYVTDVDIRNNYTFVLDNNKGLFIIQNNLYLGNKIEPGLPDQVNLFQNYPNPFNPSTTILYDLPKESNVQLVIYDLLGHVVTVLEQERKSAGSYKIIWDGKDTRGTTVPAGVYFAKMTTLDFSQTIKLVLIK